MSRSSILDRWRYYWRIFWLYRRFEAMRMMAHRGDFLFWAGISVMWTIFNFFFFGVVLTISGSIGSWSPNEMYLLMSVFTLLDACTWSIFYQNMKEYTQGVFSGQLSMLLLQPVNPMFALLTRRNSYNNLPRVFIGIAGIVVTAQRLPQPPSLIEVLAGVLLMITALALIYAIWFMFATISFWVDRLDNINDIIPSIRRIWQLPREVYQGGLGVFLTVIFPIGLVSSLPAEMIGGRHVWWWAIYFVMITLLTCGLAYAFFHLSLRRYSSIGD